MKKIIAGLMLAVMGLIVPVAAQAQANVECELVAPMFTTSGDTLADHREAEYLYIVYENTGDADAANLVVTLTLPDDVTLYAGTAVTNVGTVAAGASNRVMLRFDVGDLGVAYGELEWTATCAYDGADTQTLTGVTQIRPELERTFVGYYDGPVSVHPNGFKVVYKSDDNGYSDYNLVEYDIRDGSYRQLTHDYSGSWCNSHPIYSPDGSMIAWHRPHNDSGIWSPSVWVMKSDGTKQTLVVEGDNDHEWSPLAWAGNNKLVVSRTSWSSQGREIFVVKPDGTGLTRITPEGQGYQKFAAATKNLIAVRGSSRSASVWEGQDQIELWGVDGEFKRALPAAKAMFPQFQPGTNRLLFKGKEDQECWSVNESIGDLFTIKTNGDEESLKCLTCDITFRECASKGHYNPSGKAIAFQRRLRDASYYTDFWLMKANGGKPTRVTFTPTVDRGSESPSLPQLVNRGKMVLFGSRATPSGNIGLVLLTLDKKLRNQLGLIPVDDDSGSSSSDGCAVVSDLPGHSAHLALLLLPLAAGLLIRRRFSK
ncbi:MAG TPA: hypothetical protein ENN74_04395 [Firmicutes bacterium]|nr:hypothetical protein [Bacillota bacterium]